jgi:hypothetical protein
MNDRALNAYAGLASSNSRLARTQLAGPTTRITSEGVSPGRTTQNWVVLRAAQPMVSG